MTPVRPPVSAFTQPSAPRPDPARTAAQKAFFQAALGQAAEPLATPAPVVPAVTAKMPRELSADPPAKPLRPGSLLDIRV